MLRSKLSAVHGLKAFILFSAKPGAGTVGNKLPQDALNPAHGSLLRVNSHSQETFYMPFSFLPIPLLLSYTS
jgi:hypothetical protein